MSKGARKLEPQRAIAQVRGEPSAVGRAQIVEDPITIGPNRTINIDLGKLTAPTNVYDADFAWLVHRPGVVSLFFAKQTLSKGTDFRTRLELRYPPEGLVNHLWRNSRDFHARLREFVEKWPKDEARDGFDPTKWTAQRDHSEWVNFEVLAHAGTEATLDFYSLPPVGVARFTKGAGSAGLQVSPVVRVQTTVFELLRLLDSAADVVAAIETYLPKPPAQPSE